MNQHFKNLKYTLKFSGLKFFQRWLQDSILFIYFSVCDALWEPLDSHIVCSLWFEIYRGTLHKSIVR